MLSEEMPEHPLRRILSRTLVPPNDASNYEIVYVHRGAPDDRVSMRASELESVAKGSFILKDGETQIPFHRILTIRDIRNGLLLWEKRSVRASDPSRQR